MYKHILMPTDGSALSQAAVREGLQLAKENGAKVTFMNVAAPFHVFAYDAASLSDTWSDYDRHAHERSERILSECEKAAGEAGVSSAKRFAVSEHPYEEIVKAASETGADIIVMASHARKGMQGVFLGSQTQKTLARSKTPVLVIR
ncbi:MAG TPA: universal stress protein [Burkholderiales bacterium]|nr:universal stress protein [Burkholderiales bacterium]